MSFSFLGLSESVLQAVAERGYHEPTPIQQAAIPAILQGRDILGIAQTGTGKTASFTLPLLDILGAGRSRARMPRSLILEPTRELAHQVAESFECYGKYHKLSKALLIGGVAFGDQDKALERGVDVLIATPGRLLDQCERSKILMSGVEILVIDEADRMLDMGFIPDVAKICAMLPAKRQTLFFSATMPPPVTALADRFLRDPKRIEVSRPASTAASIAQKRVHVSPRQKREALRHFLRDTDVQNAIVFCNRKRDVKLLLDSLKRHQFNAVALHGDMDQKDRLDTLERFRAGDTSVLVASDVAARGLDIPSVSHVFNFDVPTQPDDYVHRIGRTGRAGRSGTAIIFSTPDDDLFIAAIETRTGQTIACIPLPGMAPTEDTPAPKAAPARRAPRRAPAKAALPRTTESAPAESSRRAQPAMKKGPRLVTTDLDVDHGSCSGWGAHTPNFFNR